MRVHGQTVDTNGGAEITHGGTEDAHGGTEDAHGGTEDAHGGTGDANGGTGEVTQALLDGAIQTTSANSNSVNQLTASADLSYQSSQMQEVMNKLDELIWALRRS